MLVGQGSSQIIAALVITYAQGSKSKKQAQGCSLGYFRLIRYLTTIRPYGRNTDECPKLELFDSFLAFWFRVGE
jgi:hypothetical protein